jgi:hypothetical protein
MSSPRERDWERSTRRANRKRKRDELRRRNYLPEVCPRCHRERCVDTHELIRRSQHADAAAELELMTPVGRECHDWIGHHPTQAVDEGWALWRWQLADDEAIRAAEWRRLEASVFAWAIKPREPITLPADETGNVIDMPRPHTGRIPVTVRFDPEDLDWLKAAANARGIDVAETLRRLVKASREAARPAHSTLTGRAHGPVPKAGR